MFKVISVRGNSVRINAGLVSFDVLVEVNNGRKIIKKPNAIFIMNKDMAALVKTVLDAYELTVEKGITEDATQTIR